MKEAKQLLKGSKMEQVRAASDGGGSRDRGWRRGGEEESEDRGGMEESEDGGGKERWGERRRTKEERRGMREEWGGMGRRRVEDSRGEERRIE
eukprot:2422581-Rhodomonas_salina.1